MVQSPTPLQDHRCQVVSNRHCGGDLYILRLQSQSPFQCQPGQFVMLDLPTESFHFRRPFSVLAVHADGHFDIYYKVVGKGTRMMAAFEPGLALRCLGPLGNAFPQPQSPPTALLIGGGIGIAPLYFLGKQLPGQAHCFYGVRTWSEIGLETELMDVFGKRFHLATDDGSQGLQGTVCDLLRQHPETVQAAQDAYICGPTGMMAAAAQLLQTANPRLRVYVSLEEHMPCGTGACTGCVVPRADRYLPSKVCVEGPVFEARQIRWPGQFLPADAFCPEERPCPL